ncbi:uncharacterized protein LTR77_007299 [Saxophila tyrrhenica]|uniref:Autophagy-related protein 14 n=1 Tax=Saxophila tyrrhenica TaxID=1690608 RepID=A0AAV9P8A7_9PEZI|nr:hypothetical protein LTR77_007299 [Saxophila tyrrhenica]
MASSASVRRDRSYLLPSNRSKLRNLSSISLRNVTLDTPASPAARRRGKTIDDDALPNTLQSPAKLVALRERENKRGALEHSRSSSDLRAATGGTAVSDDGDEAGEDGFEGPENGSPLKSRGKARQSQGTRPRMPGRMRRRSTLEWAHSTPQRRQERLERALEERMVDVFFSLHVLGVEEPIYVSETVAKTMNATFRHLDLETCGPGVLRSQRLVVKVWVRSKKANGWKQLLDLDVHLEGLQYLGKNLDALDNPLPQNALLFHMTDGIYMPPTSLTAFRPAHSGAPPLPARSMSSRILATSSFDALLRLAKLDDSIQDALATRNKLALDLENLLAANRVVLEERDKVAEAHDRLKTIEYAKSLVQKQVDKARIQIDEKRASLSKRRQLMSQDLSARKHRLSDMQATRSDLALSHTSHDVLQKAIRGQRRRIISTLQTIYPISPLPSSKPLQFAIRSLHLPDSDALDTSPPVDPSTTPETIAAALGYAAHILQLLAYYLRSPLPYPVTPRASSSTISDPISKLPTSASTTQRYEDEVKLRTYPLYSRGVPRFRFEYAVFLLNKDVQILLEECFGVKVMDVRQTAANLGLLVYVATAGEGELPARKAGGVRGLMRDRGGSSDTVDGKNVKDDGASGFKGIVRKKAEGREAPTGGGGIAKGAVESLRRNMGQNGS